MSTKKISVFVLVSLLLAMSAQAKLVQQPPKQQLRPQTRISERFSEIAKQPVLPREIKDCRPPCPTGYDFVAGRATPPTEGAYQTWQGYWYACKVNDDIKNRASCASGFDKIWLDQANAYDCVCHEDATCLQEKSAILARDPNSPGNVRAADFAYTGCLRQHCSYSKNSACPADFTFKTSEEHSEMARYICVIPGYTASDYNFSNPQSNAWNQPSCNAACNSLETVTDPADGTIKCFK